MLVDYVSTNGDELKTTDLAIEQVAAEAGFGSAAVMREHFGTVVGTSPLSVPAGVFHPCEHTTKVTTSMNSLESESGTL